MDEFLNISRLNSSNIQYETVFLYVRAHSVWIRFCVRDILKNRQQANQSSVNIQSSVKISLWQSWSKSHPQMSENPKMWSESGRSCFVTYFTPQASSIKLPKVTLLQKGESTKIFVTYFTPDIGNDWSARVAFCRLDCVDSGKIEHLQFNMFCACSESLQDTQDFYTTWCYTVKSTKRNNNVHTGRRT